MSSRRPRTPRTTICHPAESTVTTLQGFVRNYLEKCYDGHREHLEWYAGLTSDKERQIAAIWKFKDGCHPHQRRMPKATKECAPAKLDLEKIKQLESFTDLIKEVEGMIGKERGVAELAVYDAANRLSMMHPGIGRPTFIYLHRGSRDGARALGLDHRQPYLDPNELPDWVQEAFEDLRSEPDHIENFLCIYKAQLANCTREA